MKKSFFIPLSEEKSLSGIRTTPKGWKVLRPWVRIFLSLPRKMDEFEIKDYGKKIKIKKIISIFFLKID
jgi:hypothetical protein